MAIGDVYELDFQILMADKVVSTSMHYAETVVRSGTVAQVTAQLAADVQTDFWTNFLKTYSSSFVSYWQTRSQMIYPTREAPVWDVALRADGGTVIEGAVNPQVAVLVAQNALTWSREFRGRAFLPGLGEEYTTKGRIVSATHALLQLSAQAFYAKTFVLAGPANGTFQPQVLSPKRLKASTPPVVSQLITAIVRPRMSRQVRRQTPTETVYV